MRHLIGISVLLALALALKFWVHSGIGFGIYMHDALKVVPLNVIGFWLLMGIANCICVVPDCRVCLYS
jgi:hypothetical protein